ncbi:uncharacterized protein LOC142353111 isoform X2 [Convolutriloba macropyga]|uniref:uncharacterized protein LOC142353111 isoform X2 n=1 Tax=Convolutriloba macropyga TaxID=536237 RepID=UPI003F51F7F8
MATTMHIVLSLVLLSAVGSLASSASSASSSPAQTAVATTCESHTTCSNCLGAKEGDVNCVFFTCNLDGNDEKKCGKNDTAAVLCSNASAPIMFTEKCEKKSDNPVEELDDDQKSGDQKQVDKYHATQEFDLASFVGGIALSVCLAGIAFIIYKLWQSKQQQISYTSVDGGSTAKSQY